MIWLPNLSATLDLLPVRRSLPGLPRLECLAQKAGRKRKRNVLELISYSICAIFLGLSIYSRESRRIAFSSVFVVYSLNTAASQYFYLDSYMFFITAIICDVLIGLMLMRAYSETKPDYISHTLLILVGMCAVNVLGLMLYASDVNEYFYSGAMFVCNCALILRLMIATRRDGDGYMDYRFLGSGWGADIAKILRNGKVV